MTSELVARTGRHQQRYRDGRRLVAGCIPYKYVGQTFRVLMITSESGPGLIFPKGGWEIDEEEKEGAQREALEEAGVQGEIKECLGCWDSKSKNPRDEYEGLCSARMFPLYVKEELNSWPEQNKRQRLWLSVDDAREKCRHEWMREALEECASRYGTLTSSESAASVKVNTNDLPS